LPNLKPLYERFGKSMVSKWIFVSVSAVMIAGCGIFGKAVKPAAAPPPYPPLTNVLDEDYLHSPSGDIAAHFPNGWLHVDIQSIPMTNVEEVYTDPDRRWALVLAEIPATAEFRRNVARDGMMALADQSFAQKSAKAHGKLVITRPAEIYSENGKLFASYDYAEAGTDTNDRSPSLHRIENREVLFTTGSKFYELGMINVGTLASPAETVQNFRLLESVTASLEGVAEIRADTL
jgi:hypothetical protein